MTREKIYDILNDVFRDVFDDDTITVHDETTADDIEEWDSMEHINLIIAIENCFHLKFTIDEVSKIQTVGEMVGLIMEKMS